MFSHLHPLVFAALVALAPVVAVGVSAGIDALAHRRARQSVSRHER